MKAKKGKNSHGGFYSTHLGFKRQAIIIIIIPRTTIMIENR